MSVDADVTRRIIAEEMAAALELARTYNWVVTIDFPAVKVTVRMKSAVDGEEYVVEAQCDDYRAKPPLFEFIHPATGERGTHAAYPDDGGRSQPFFHPAPCVCIQWNRKAYGEFQGPHGDWPMADWVGAVRGQDRLGDMFHLIQREINLKDIYRGRRKSP
jgi:hypothetical protein